jgi:hypothetical protein
MKNSLLLLLILAAACTGGGRSPSIDEAVTQQVFDHHVQTFKDNDLEAVMADYIEESVLITPDRTYKGLQQIRENFVNAFKVLPKDGTTFTVDKTAVNGDVAYFVWKATTPTMVFKYATDTFIIQDGKIMKQTYAGDVVGVSTEDAVSN